MGGVLRIKWAIFRPFGARRPGRVFTTGALSVGSLLANLSKLFHINQKIRSPPYTCLYIIKATLNEDATKKTILAMLSHFKRVSLFAPLIFLPKYSGIDFFL